MALTGKVAVVTGAAGGFGRGIAERFAAEGAKVVLADINAALGEATAAAINERGGDARFARCDVTKDGDMAALAAAAEQAFGRLDIWVNNAGVSHPIEDLAAVAEAEFDRVLAINVKSVYLSARHAAPVFRRQASGCFVNIASVSALRPRPGITWYAASKAAVITATRGMAIELAPQKIRVNAINPVAGDTPFLGAHGQDSPELRERFVSTIPLGRLAQPADIASAALFLASDEASLITGAILDVDGGRGI